MNVTEISMKIGSDSGYGSMAGFCERRNELPDPNPQAA
jgi:hypothetical protein